MGDAPVAETFHTGDLGCRQYWHIHFDIRTCVHGLLQISRNTVYDGAPFEEVPLGHPREWRRFGPRLDLAQQVLHRPDTTTNANTETVA
ncbi:hypothetical protein ABZS86_10055 [Streptomyces sp. NPDC005355]|uniref:hypothetical protein n=1 Tax=Streptomyces sp. NPDC005355 TaxID=3157038 RepID=UPI0033B28045